MQHTAIQPYIHTYSHAQLVSYIIYQRVYLFFISHDGNGARSVRLLLVRCIGYRCKAGYRGIGVKKRVTWSYGAYSPVFSPPLHVFALWCVFSLLLSLLFLLILILFHIIVLLFLYTYTMFGGYSRVPLSHKEGVGIRCRYKV